MKVNKDFEGRAVSKGLSAAGRGWFAGIDTALFMVFLARGDIKGSAFFGVLMLYFALSGALCAGHIGRIMDKSEKFKQHKINQVAKLQNEVKKLQAQINQLSKMASSNMPSQR